MNAKLPSGIVCLINLLMLLLHSVLRSSILYFTFHIHVYVYMYYTPDRPTDFHSSTRLNSGSHSAELVQSTKTTTDPSRIFLVARHTTSPHHHHHHLTTTTATTTATATLSLVVPFPIGYRATTPQATPWLEHLFLYLYLSLSPALSPAHTLYSLTLHKRRGDIYLLRTRNP